MTTRDWTLIPLPARMEKLAKDRRGLPIPFIVMMDGDKPIFTANDAAKGRDCVIRKTCPICGDVLDEVFWFVGGPLSAFHPQGWYIDSAMHKECLDYAMQVCPYMSMPKYLHRIDGATASPEMKKYLFIDPTMLPGRPEIFVSVGATRQDVAPNLSTGAGLITRPRKPWFGIEFWKEGEQIPGEEGMSVVRKALKAGPSAA